MMAGITFDETSVEEDTPEVECEHCGCDHACSCDTEPCSYCDCCNTTTECSECFCDHKGFTDWCMCGSEYCEECGCGGVDETDEYGDEYGECAACKGEGD